jgi:hypothetical protein
VQRSSRRVLPSSGHGEVLHLNQDRTLTFRVQRLTRERVQTLLGQAVELDSLAEFELQLKLAVAYLTRASADACAIDSSARPLQQASTTT